MINMKNSMLLYLVLSITVWVAPAHAQASKISSTPCSSLRQSERSFPHSSAQVVTDSLVCISPLLSHFGS